MVDRYHALFLESWEKLGISFDLFTHTNTANHESVTHDIFNTLLDKGYIYTDSMLLAYCDKCVRFLPDGMWEAPVLTAPTPALAEISATPAGGTLDPRDLVAPRCALSGDTPEFRESEHFSPPLGFPGTVARVGGQAVPLARHVLNFTRRFLEDGLHDRAISRDLEWESLSLWRDTTTRGFTFGLSSDRLSVGRRRGAKLHGEPDSWQDFWKDPRAAPITL